MLLSSIGKGTKSSNLSLKKQGNRVFVLVFAVFIFGIGLILVNIYQLRTLQSDHVAYHGFALVEGVGDKFESGGRPVVWVEAKRPDSGYLQHVFAIFDRAGYQRTYRGGHDDLPWDVLWAHDYPFSKLKEFLLNLKPHQRVNHWPGSGFITNKAHLVTSNLKHTPKAFKMPEEREQLLSYARHNPLVMWVQKSSNHRGIQIKPVHNLDLKSGGTFVQEYIHDPYLIDGHRFDIGIYAVLTSIDPLRVYIYDGDWLIRFCAEKYYPFNKANIKKYVVTDDYKPIWKIYSLDKFFNVMDYTAKETILAQLRLEARDGEKLVADLRQAIVDVYLAKEADLIESSSKYKSTRNFFEMVRFDFVLDKYLNVYLMEVNMSPNLSSGHFRANRLLYEHVVYGLLSLVGVVRDTINMQETSDTEDEKNMLASSRDIRVYSDACASDICHDNCGKQICRLCGECMKPRQVETFKNAYMEHNNRKTFRRIFPVPFKNQEDALAWEPEKDGTFANLTYSNQWMTRWFHGKCLQDSTWCS